MPRMTGGEAVVQTLVAEEVEAVFGLPGTHALAMFDALQDAPSIRRITTRHEQGATFMADGYARASGDIGVCLLSTGPAAANSITAMSTAYADSSPVLNISSQMLTADVGDGRGYLHDVSDQLGAFAHVTGWSARAKSVTAVPWLVHEAISKMRTGRPRPAALEVPKDVLDATGEATVLPRSPRVVPSPDPRQVAQASDMLLRARRPVIWAGGGAAQASEQIARLAESLEAPVLTTATGKGTLPDTHPLALGAIAAQHPAVWEYLSGCDLVLVVGSKLGPNDTAAWKLPLPEALVHIDLDPAVIGRTYPATLAMVSDARQALEALLRTVEASIGERTSRADEVAGLRASFRQMMLERSEEAVALIDEIRAAVPPGGVIAGDVTISTSWASLMLEVDHPRNFMKPGSGALGAGLPLAMGAKVARPESPALAICGDGGFMYTAAELSAAVQSGINVVALVVNDSKFGILEPQQIEQFGRTTMVDLHNPDFVKLAESFGAYGVCVDSVTEVGQAIRAAFAEERPAVVELRTSIPFPYDL